MQNVDQQPFRPPPPPNHEWNQQYYGYNGGGGEHSPYQFNNDSASPTSKLYFGAFLSPPQNNNNNNSGGQLGYNNLHHETHDQRRARILREQALSSPGSFEQRARAEYAARFGAAPTSSSPSSVLAFLFVGGACYWFLVFVSAFVDCFVASRSGAYSSAHGDFAFTLPFTFYPDVSRYIYQEQLVGIFALAMAAYTLNAAAMAEAATTAICVHFIIAVGMIVINVSSTLAVVQGVKATTSFFSHQWVQAAGIFLYACTCLLFWIKCKISYQPN